MRKCILKTPEGKEFIFNIPDDAKTDYRGFYRTNTKQFKELNPDIDFKYLSFDLDHRGLNQDNDFYERNGVKLPKFDFFTKLLREPISKKSDNWEDTSYRWLITLDNKTFDYYTGSGLTYTKQNGDTEPKRPTLEDVLYSLTMDSYAANETFQSWCFEYGYDTDSRKALATYEACQKIADDLRELGFNLEQLQEYFQDY